jgi:hypothetical protein
MQAPQSATNRNSGEIPPHLDRWNWGAFLLNWIWGIGNSVWIALLCLIPVINLVMMFVLGAKGSKWAWQSRSWRDEEHFRRTQRNWAIAGLAVWAGSFLLFASIFFGVFAAMKNSEAYAMSMAEIVASEPVRAALGDNIEPGFFVSGNIQLNGGEGTATLEIPLKGSRGAGTAYSRAEKIAGTWQVILLVVRVGGSETPMVLINRDNVPVPGGPLES